MCIPNMVSKLSKIISHPQTIIGWIPLRNDKLYISLGFYTNGHFWFQPTILDVYRIPFTHDPRCNASKATFKSSRKRRCCRSCACCSRNLTDGFLMTGFATDRQVIELINIWAIYEINPKNLIVTAIWEGITL